ncbi:tRNA pseudouridine(55) synthase TruB [Acetivibrio clariflavus]|uniref:tRNA pseudouridine synthase B n=1 Tax=Acetivibrio clariflavus (strain DSM 19732 / NBRC 101661 / EBR45) TaxID=720554 RepID=G8LZT5_ACECE|nr:tRNA pseudouridine(55) synthase TruB [Acetivibrio clariflavus]AEV69025.1 tRNA pseudouridine synthase B [Acetivibrio clariflavus DSM 19732]HOQ00550.1 tRNA pseudouridine(55) synthase TruB [Acetivibrio clariflavus]
MDGILNILKPPGMTSFDVVAYLRRLLKEKKIGHTGTLDPGAVGVLPVCIGKATKTIEYLTDKDKEYRAELTLGISTDTQDSYGNVLKKCDVNIEKEEIYKAIMSFVGEYNQIPPMYSAVKVEGKKLYELARDGITIERAPRKVAIHSIDIVNIKDNRVIFDVVCSKGTYIRTLCSDIGEKLGCGGHMSFLVRTRSGSFKLSDSLTLEEIYEFSKDNSIEDKLLPIEKVFDDLERIDLSDVEAKKLINGAYVKLKGENYKKGNIIRAYDDKGKFIGICEILPIKGSLLLKIKKKFG